MNSGPQKARKQTVDFSARSCISALVPLPPSQTADFTGTPSPFPAYEYHAVPVRAPSSSFIVPLRNGHFPELSTLNRHLRKDTLIKHLPRAGHCASTLHT